MKTNTKKIIALVSILGILIVNVGNVFAEKIGTGSIVGSESTSDINWDGTFSGLGNASGSISGIKVTAIVEPILDMRLSADSINLGSVTSQSNNGITIEVGTNSPSGVIVTATSQHGGLKHKTDNVSINNTNSGTYAYASSANNPDLQNSTYLDTTHINTPSQLVQIYKSSGAEILNSSDDDISFTVTAQAQTSAPAGEYEDYITFTILASF